MKRFLKKLEAAPFERLLAPIRQMRRGIERLSNVDRGTQILLSLKYQQMRERGERLPSFGDVGFREFSGTDEDGILLYIFSLIGVQNKTVVDIGAALPQGSNSANLLINHGWTGLLIEGSINAVLKAREFYLKHPETSNYPPKIIQAWITAENINDIILEAALPKQVDLLSIDIDGIDYWVLEAIDSVSPRVITVEYQDILGPERAWVVPYRPDFNPASYEANLNEPNYLGASLPAFTKLANRKGYRLVGCNRYGFNAFFVRSDIGEEFLPEVSIADCLVHPKAQAGMRERFPKIADMDWVEV